MKISESEVTPVASRTQECLRLESASNHFRLNDFIGFRVQTCSDHRLPMIKLGRTLPWSRSAWPRVLCACLGLSCTKWICLTFRPVPWSHLKNDTQVFKNLRFSGECQALLHESCGTMVDHHYDGSCEWWILPAFELGTDRHQPGLQLRKAAGGAAKLHVAPGSGCGQQTFPLSL